MSRSRFEDALLIQNPGACNPPGVARALVRAIDECRADANSNPRNDPAVQLILHQLAYICGMGDIACGAWDGWDAATKACEQKVAAAKAAAEPAVEG